MISSLATSAFMVPLIVTAIVLAVAGRLLPRAAVIPLGVYAVAYVATTAIGAILIAGFGDELGPYAEVAGLRLSVLGPVGGWRYFILLFLPLIVPATALLVVARHRPGGGPPRRLDGSVGLA